MNALEKIERLKSFKDIYELKYFSKMQEEEKDLRENFESILLQISSKDKSLILRENDPSQKKDL